MMHGHFAVISSNKDVHFGLRYTKVYYISLNSQKKGLSQLIIYIKIGKEKIK